MTAASSNSGPRSDRAVVLLCWAALFALYLFLFRVLEGSWTNLVQDFGRIIAPVVVYLGLVVTIMMLARRAGAAQRWWVLLLLPASGAVAGIVAHAIGRERGTVQGAIMLGVFYGLIHALLLRWSYRRDAGRAQTAAA